MDDVAETFKEEEFIAGIEEAIQHIVGPGSLEDSKIEDSEENSSLATPVAHTGALNVHPSSPSPQTVRIQTEQAKKAPTDVDEQTASKLNSRTASADVL